MTINPNHDVVCCKCSDSGVVRDSRSADEDGAYDYTWCTCEFAEELAAKYPELARAS